MCIRDTGSIADDVLISVPFYPDGQSFVGYCGHDDIQIDILDLWQELDNGHNDLISYVNHLKTKFSGDFDAVLAANWIRPQECESEDNFETMVHRTLTMDEPLED